MQRRIHLFLLGLLCGLWSCNLPDHTSTTSFFSDFSPQQNIESEGFSIATKGNLRHVRIIHPWIKNEVYADYLLVPKAASLPTHIPEHVRVIRTPIEKVVVLASPHVGLLAEMNLLSKIVGVGNLEHMYHPEIHAQYHAGKIKQLGKEHALNVEMMMDHDAELVIATGRETIPEKMRSIERAGIPVAYHIEYMENTPIGRAEWIRFLAVFFDAEQRADSVLAHIKKEYEAAQKLALQAKNPPRVLAGYNLGGTWYMPGGNSYVGALLRDGQTHYKWGADSTKGSIPLSFETVVEQMLDAEIWVNPGGCKSATEMLAVEPRYALFSAFKNNRVFNNTRRIGPLGSNDYWESGIAKPHLILKDLIKLFHPEILPDHQLYYYEHLNTAKGEH